MPPNNSPKPNAVGTDEGGFLKEHLHFKISFGISLEAMKKVNKEAEVADKITRVQCARVPLNCASSRTESFAKNYFHENHIEVRRVRRSVCGGLLHGARRFV
jgi:hypothetical protein